MTKILDDLFYMGVKALIQDENKNILILESLPQKTAAGIASYWDLPGGRAQPNEPIFTALKREVYEETNTEKLSIGELFDICIAKVRLSHPNHESVGLTLVTYHCFIPKNHIIKLPPETNSYQWASPTLAAKLLKNKYPSSFLDKIIKL